MSQLHSELKKEFQLERMILFSDAVFAIAITLLVIELKVPEIERAELTEGKLLMALAHMIPKFFGFIISFMFIGIYWTVHHRLFGFTHAIQYCILQRVCNEACSYAGDILYRQHHHARLIQPVHVAARRQS